MDRSRVSEAVPETRRAPVDRLRQILMGALQQEMSQPVIHETIQDAVKDCQQFIGFRLIT